MKHFALIFLTILLLPATGNAALKYKPGTVGFLYDNCRKALEQSTKAEELYETYCAGFAEGYLTGLAVSNGINLPPPRIEDPCQVEKTEAYAHINTRICPRIPVYDDKMTPASMLRIAADIITRWVDFIGEEGQKKQATDMLVDLTGPGPFCEALGKSDIYDKPYPEINPGLSSLSWKDYMRIKDYVTLSRKYMQCTKDLQYAGGNLNKFRATWCGAEIMGFLSGVRSTEHLQARKSVEGSCGKEIDRLYKGLDVRQTMCVTPDTDIMKVARIFMQRYESGLKESKGFMNSGNLGAVGFETIYTGFLCTN